MENRQHDKKSHADGARDLGIRCDSVNPIRLRSLRRDILKKEPGSKSEHGHVNELGQSFQVRRTGAAADQRHERRDIIEIPEAATPPKGLGSGHEGIQDHCQFELGNF